MTPIGLMRPRVFISSTIRDFRDLRSALRYWLESAGYDVQLSEYNDFDRTPQDDVFKACFENIKGCDHYILLIGTERGSWYKESERVTVTRQEFRVAAQASMSRPMGIFILVREDVAVALKQWEADGCPASSSAILCDPVFTRDFLEDVKQHVGKDQGPRWYYRFADFRDIVDALRVPLRLHTNIERELLRENLLNELLYNLSLMGIKTDDGTFFPHYAWADRARKEITIRPEDIGGKVGLTSKQLGSIGAIPLSLRSSLRRSAISEGLRLGLFLKIDPQSGDIERTEAHIALDALNEDIASLELRRDAPQQQFNMEFMMLGRQANRGELGKEAYVDADKLTMLMGLHDKIEDVFKGIVAFAQWLLGVVASPSIQRNPLSPIEGMSQEIEKEQAASADLQSALINQIFPFGRRLTPQLRDRMLGNIDRFVEDLQTMIPEGVMSDEQLQELVRASLNSWGVEPDAGGSPNNPLPKPGQAND